MHSASSYWDTHLYLLHHNSSVNLTTTYVQNSGQITNGMRCRKTTLQDSVLLPWHQHPPGMPSQEQLGSGWTAFTLVSDVSTPAGKNGVWPPLWHRRTKHRTCFPPMSNPSTSSWTAQLDNSGWWDNRMAAQHLPWGLVQPSSGYEELAQKKNDRVSLSLLQARFSHEVSVMLYVGGAQPFHPTGYFHTSIYVHRLK